MYVVFRLDLAVLEEVLVEVAPNLECLLLFVEVAVRKKCVLLEKGQAAAHL
jgi:hypothetical protein